MGGVDVERRRWREWKDGRRGTSTEDESTSEDREREDCCEDERRKTGTEGRGVPHKAANCPGSV